MSKEMSDDLFQPYIKPLKRYNRYFLTFGLACIFSLIFFFLALINPSVIRLRFFLSIIGPIIYTAFVLFFEFLFTAVHPLWVLTMTLIYATANYLVISSVSCRYGYQLAVLIAFGASAMIYVVYLLFRSFGRWQVARNRTATPVSPGNLEIRVFDDAQMMVSTTQLVERNSAPTIPAIDDDPLVNQQLNQTQLGPKKTLARMGWRRFGVGFAMMLMITVTWICCLLFARLLQIDESASVWVLVGYSLSTFILLQITMALNRKLPPIQQVQHLANLLEVLINLYYRFFFFFGNPNWIFLIVNSVIWTAGQWILFPLQFTRIYFDQIRSRLAGWSDKSRWTRWIFVGPHYEPQLSFETFILIKSVQYHFSMLADYYAIV